MALALTSCSLVSSSASPPASAPESLVGRPPDVSQSAAATDPPPSSGEASSSPTTTSQVASTASAPTTSAEEISAAEASRAAAEANRGRQFGGEEFGLSERELVERSQAVEVRIGECMAATGFEYLPVEFATTRSAMSSDKSAPGLSSSEFVAQYGFGISTQFEKPIVELSIGEQNTRIIEGLGEADRVAYIRTLFGEYADATYAFGLETEDFSRTGGCTRQAIESYFTPEDMSASYFNPGDALIETDPRAMQAIADWYQCMVDGGFDGFLHPDDVEISFQRRLDAITRGTDPRELTGGDLDALTQLQAEERAVASVFTECEITVLDPVMNQVEAEFYGR